MQIPVDWTSKYNKPLIMSEFGGDARFGFHGDALTRWSEEVSGKPLCAQIAMLKPHSMSAWNGTMDSERLSQPATHPAGNSGLLNRKGLVHEHGEKKKAFFVLQKFYRECKALHRG